MLFGSVDVHQHLLCVSGTFAAVEGLLTLTSLLATIAIARAHQLCGGGRCRACDIRLALVSVIRMAQTPPEVILPHGTRGRRHLPIVHVRTL